MQSEIADQYENYADGELLRRYVESRDDVALSELVARHAALVRVVCRRVLGDGPDADDAFQATFLVLIRAGDRIQRQPSVAAWLYGVALRISKRQLRGRIPQPQFEVAAWTAPATDPLAELATRHDVELFDAELSSLPEKYRTPIVLHHLEGKTQREVAAALRLSEGAVNGLLKRGRTELRARLFRRGVVMGVTFAVWNAARSASASAITEPLVAETVRRVLSLDPTLFPSFPITTAGQMARQEIFMITATSTTKTVGWMLAASALFGTGVFGVGHGMGSTATRNVAGMTLPGGFDSLLRPSSPDPQSESLPANTIAFNDAKVADDSDSRTDDDEPAADSSDGDSPADQDGDDRPAAEPEMIDDDAPQEEQPVEMEADDKPEPEQPEQDENDDDDPAEMVAMEDRDEKEEEEEDAESGSSSQANSARRRAATRRIHQQLNSTTTIAFTDTSLRDAMDYLEKMHKLNVLIDVNTIQADGGTADSPVNLEVEDVALSSTLNLILRPADLDYLVKDEVLVITSRTAAEKHLEIRVYNVEEIDVDSETPERVWESLIKQSVGGRWVGEDAAAENVPAEAGSVRCVANRLVVRQNQRVHREIESLLEQLRLANEGE